MRDELAQEVVARVLVAVRDRVRGPSGQPSVSLGWGVGPKARIAMSSRSRPSEAAMHRRLHAIGHRVRRQPCAGLEQGHQLAVAEDLLAAAPDLGDAVGVEDEHVAARRA